MLQSSSILPNILQLYQHHFLLQQSCRIADVDGGFGFITGEDPDFDASVAEVDECPGHPLLREK